MTNEMPKMGLPEHSGKTRLQRKIEQGERRAMLATLENEPVPEEEQGASESLTSSAPAAESTGFVLLPEHKK